MKETEMPKVSVVVAAYNEERFLRKNIESVLEQTYRNLEIIYVDDGSQDQTLAILREYESKDARMHVFTQENQGAGAARNRGLDAATGKYVCVVDSDDTFEPDMIAEAVMKAELYEADLVFWSYSMCNIMNGDKFEIRTAVRTSLLPGKPCFCADDIPEGIFMITGGWGWNKMFRLDFLHAHGHRFQNIAIIDDAFLSIATLATARRICAINKPFVNYTMNNTHSQFADSARVTRQFYLAAKKMRAWMQERGLLEKFQYALDTWIMRHFSIALTKCPTWGSYKESFAQIRSHLEEFGVAARVKERYHGGYEQQDYFERFLSEPPEVFLREEYLQMTLGRTFLFPKERFQKEDRVIIYGAGDLGRHYHEQAKQYCQVVGWVDKGYRRMSYPVTSLEAAMEKEFDYVLIAVDSILLAKVIQRDLVQQGIPEEKIVWTFPRVRPTTY